MLLFIKDDFINGVLSKLFIPGSLAGPPSPKNTAGQFSTSISLSNFEIGKLSDR